ncbi:MAG: HEAT repeat domain-containing protein [Planctomycetota bacterium]
MKIIRIFLLAVLCLAGIIMPFAWSHESATPAPPDPFGGSQSLPPLPPAQTISEDYILYDTVYNLIPQIDKKGTVFIDSTSGKSQRRMTPDIPAIDFIYSYIIPFDSFLLSGWEGLTSTAPEADKPETFKPALNLYFRRLLMTNYIKLTQLSPMLKDNYPEAQLSEYLIEIGQPSLIIIDALRKALAKQKTGKRSSPGVTVNECVGKAIDVAALQPAPGAITSTDCFVTLINRLIVEELSKDYYYQSYTSFAQHLRALGEQIIPYVIEAAKKNTHSLIRRNAIALLSYYDTPEHPEVRAVLRESLKSPDKVVRNRALLALINKDDTSISPFLIETLKTSDDPFFKTFAAYALGQLREKQAVKPLIDYINSDPNNLDVLWVALPALGKIGDKSAEVIKLLKHFVEWKRPPTRTWALLSLAALGDQTAVDRMKIGPTQKDPFQRMDPATRYFALKVFKNIGGEYVQLLLDLTKNRNFDTRLRLSSLCHVKLTEKQLPQLRGFVEDEKMTAVIKAYALYGLFLLDDPNICQYAEAVINKAFSGLSKANLRLDGEGMDAVIGMQILGKFKSNKVPVLKDIIAAEYGRSLKMKSPDKDIEFLVPVAPVLETAIQELGKIPVKESTRELVDLLKLEKFPCRATVAMALADVKEEQDRAISALIGILSDEDGWTRYCAYRSLNKLTGKDKDFNCEWYSAAPAERQLVVKTWEKWWKEEQDKQKAK